MAGFAVAAASCALVAPGASADITGTTWTPGVGGDPNVYTLSATVTDANANVYFYDYQLDGGTTTPYILVGGGPRTVSGGTAQVSFYPTTTGQHFIYVVERSATGEFITAGGGPAIQVSTLPKSPGPAPCEPTGGSLSNGEMSINSQVPHPNSTYTLTFTLGSDQSAFAGNDVYIEESTGGFQGTVIGKTTFTNGVATVQYTPKSSGQFDLRAHTGAPDGMILGHKQFLVQISSAPTGPSGCATGGGTGSADGIPLVGGVLKALGI
ncbi:hypothetical protein ACQP1O_10710 [Nocardia sp. CA-151230]|uniref:hypothetical protein n=1 Tax=Nocardia sp. CA-151230 TaxID=3239982 RepID=UPI003D929684